MRRLIVLALVAGVAVVVVLPAQAIFGQNGGTQLCVTISMTDGSSVPVTTTGLAAAIASGTAQIDAVGTAAVCGEVSVVTTPAPPPAPTPRPAGGVTISGNGVGESASFALSAGDYRADWSESGSCVLNDLGLESDDPIYYGVIASGDGGQGTNHLHGLEAGSDYYIDSLTQCQWSVTLTHE